MGEEQLLVHNQNCGIEKMKAFQEAVEKAKARGIINEEELIRIGKKAVDDAIKVGKIAADTVLTVKYGDHFTIVGRKKKLKANISYVTPEGYKYTTNEFGAIIEVEGTLKLGEGNRNLYAQRTVGGDYRLADDDGVHLIRTQFLGSGEIDKLVPMNSQINRSGGKWYGMEQQWPVP